MGDFMEITPEGWEKVPSVPSRKKNLPPEGWGLGIITELKITPAGIVIFKTENSSGQGADLFIGNPVDSSKTAPAEKLKKLLGVCGLRITLNSYDQLKEFMRKKLEVLVTYTYTCKCEGNGKYHKESDGDFCSLCGNRIFTNATISDISIAGKHTGGGQRASVAAPATPQPRPQQPPVDAAWPAADINVPF